MNGALSSDSLSTGSSVRSSPGSPVEFAKSLITTLTGAWAAGGARG